MDNSPDNAETLEALETLNRQRLAGWWDRAGLDPHYPATTATVVHLLRAVDYLADNDTLLAYLKAGLVLVNRDGAGTLAWHANDIAAAAAQLESRRKWVPFSKIHGHKFTRVEMCKQLCEREGGAMFHDLDQHDLDNLLALTVKMSEDPQAVQIMVEAIRTKLQSLGVV